MFNGKIHYKWAIFNSKPLVYQRVAPAKILTLHPHISLLYHWNPPSLAPQLIAPLPCTPLDPQRGPIRFHISSECHHMLHAQRVVTTISSIYIYIYIYVCIYVYMYIIYVFMYIYLFICLFFIYVFICNCFIYFFSYLFIYYIHNLRIYNIHNIIYTYIY